MEYINHNHSWKKHIDYEKEQESIRPELGCSLFTPLMMVVPPGGTTISCLLHKEGHKVYGPPSTWC
jgi:hypothetical protein